MTRYALRLSSLLLGLGLLANAPGCERDRAPAATEDGPAEKVPGPRRHGERDLVIRPGGELPGGAIVQGADGRNVWPPQGPGCDRYVSCCGEAAASAAELALACQIYVATEPVSCPVALEALRSTLTERGLPVPAECTP